MISVFQRKKQSPPFWSFSPRALVALLLFGVACLTMTGTLPAFFHPEAQTQVAQRTLTFAERVAYQRAIEDVYWRHRIWPKENTDPKPSLDVVMSQEQLAKKVEDYLRNSLALEDYWQKPITAEQLQAEMDRMARDTRQPEVLQELFEALGNDPAIISECLARPVLAERLMADVSVQTETPRVESAQTDGLRTISAATTLEHAAYSLPEIAKPDVVPCPDDTWTPTTTTNAPSGRSAHTAVWTGSEMIVWGGYPISNTGGRYNPSTDSWTHTSTANAPSPRFSHTAIWTGSEMIVWGGFNNSVTLNTGGRYNPSTNSWTATSLSSAPDPRSRHSAVWTGSEMIVWGGASLPPNSGYQNVNTGGKYNPSTNTWTATNTTNAPAPRSVHTAVWTGSEMIVWGGLALEGYILRYVNTGGRYNPSTNSWTHTSTTNAPSPRGGHAAVWTGTRMIVWGGTFWDIFGHGAYLNTGGRYDPITGSWTATSMINAPSERAFIAGASTPIPFNIWTGSEMIIWGGGYNTGGRYNPVIDIWTATTLSNVPDARSGHTAVWTGSEMIVWGGWESPAGPGNTGGRYCAGVAVPVARPATLIASNSFKANWSNVSGATYRLDVATNSSFTAYVTGYRDLNVGNTTTYAVTGLNASTVYYYRVRAYNGVKTSDNSNTISVTTLTPTGAPGVVTNPATNVANNSATLNGSLDPHGLTTTVYFQYGTTTNYGRTTPLQTQTGSTYRNISAIINGLAANTVYHFRIVATNIAGTRYGADRILTLVTNDFNNDNQPDYLLFNPTTRGTVIWYMNNNILVTDADGPTLPAGWEIASVEDFNFDGRPDYLLFNPTSRATVIWYMNNNVRIGSIYGPALPGGWGVGALADLNGDGYPDYLLYNTTTGGTVVWYMRNNVHSGSASGPALPGGWTLGGIADFNGDGHPDYLLFNAGTHATVIWYMSGVIRIGSHAGPTVTAGYNVVGLSDFDRNGRPDYVLYASGTGQTVIWYLNDYQLIGSASGPTLPTGWTLAAP